MLRIVCDTMMLDAAKNIRENLSRTASYRDTPEVSVGLALLAALNRQLPGQNVGQQMERS
jgi:hypothetical protein